MTSLVHPARVAEAVVRAAARDACTVAVYAEASSAMLYLTQAIRETGLTIYHRISPHYGSMGSQMAGAIGFCAATGMRAIVLTGDGSLHLMDPLPAAVKHRMRLTVVVLDNAMLGLPEKGCEQVGANGAKATTLLEPWDFSVQGSPRIGARRISREHDLDGALAQALASDGCFVVDVLTDPSVPPPAGERHASVDAMLGVTR